MIIQISISLDGASPKVAIAKWPYHSFQDLLSLSPVNHKHEYLKISMTIGAPLIGLTVRLLVTPPPQHLWQWATLITRVWLRSPDLLSFSQWVHHLTGELSACSSSWQQPLVPSLHVSPLHRQAADCASRQMDDIPLIVNNNLFTIMYHDPTL